METTKTILAMVGLVLIGFAAGFLLQRHLTVQHFERVRSMDTSQGMKDRLLETINADQQQRMTLEPLIEQHLEDLNDLNQTYKTERANLIDSLKRVMAPEISTSQQKKLDRFTKRLIKFRKQKRKKNGRSGKKDRNNLSKE